MNQPGPPIMPQDAVEIDANNPRRGTLITPEGEHRRVFLKSSRKVN